jgi:hypothetical protein
MFQTTSYFILFCIDHYIYIFSDVFDVQLEHLFTFIVQNFQFVCYFSISLFNQEHMSLSSELVFDTHHAKL